LYNQIIEESNAGLNGTNRTIYSGIYDPTYAKAVANAKTNLTVNKLDFANMRDRIAIGDDFIYNTKK
jgi:hypothetical protein